MLPNALATFFEKENFGTLVKKEILTGGNINQTSRITTSSGTSFILKENAKSPERLFECEAAGLQLLQEAGMRTPKVWAVGLDFLLLEDLGSSHHEPDW